MTVVAVVASAIGTDDVEPCIRPAVKPAIALFRTRARIIVSYPHPWTNESE